MDYNSYFVYNTIGGFLEFTTSNQYIFTDSKSNDILLHTDFSNQNILIGTDSNSTSAIQIAHLEVDINRNLFVACNLGIGIRDFSERLVIGNGNAKFLSNAYIMNNFGAGTSNTNHLITLLGPSNNIGHGPNIAAYFSTAYPTNTETSNPVFDITNWDRDDIQLNFDCYNNGGDILSTSATGNFEIRKHLGRLQFMSTCNHPTGDIITNELYPALTINSNSYIGIATRDPTHRLTIRAPTSNAIGPHQAFYIDSDSNYPLRQFLNWNHDDIVDTYDCFFDPITSKWISSSSKGNFKIHKENGNLTFYSTCNSIPGTDITSQWLSAIAINSNSFISIGNNNNPTNRLTIRAENSNILGPHVSYFVNSDSNYPVFQQLNWTHDEISFNFDNYFDGKTSNWISSSETGNFQLRKRDGRLKILSACNTYPGSNIDQLSIAFAVNSNSYIGIGTEDPTHRLTMRGFTSNVIGPHLAFYISTDSNYPVFQQLNWNHDEISLNFDTYFEGYTSNWISSSKIGNFQIRKHNGRLKILSACNTDPGCNIDNLFIAFAVNSNSYIGIGTEDPTHRLTMRGLTSNILGPHSAVYIATDSNYPVFQQLNWNHDEITQSFDSYFDASTSNWVSSSKTGNFQIRKRDGRLKILSACNTYPGSNIDNLSIAFVVNSNSYIGIGTEDPTHRLTMRGFTSNALGPHSAVYISTDSNYPVFQQLNWNHDDITQSFDSYFDPSTSNWISSSETGNFQIRKRDGRFKILSACNTYPGSNIDQLSIAFAINSNSYIGIGTEDTTHRLTIRGPTSNILGAHTAMYLNEDSNYPVFQHLNWDHDKIYQSFDTFFDGSNWVSSSSNGNFSVAKSNGRLLFQSACNSPQGSIITNSLYTAMAINSNSFIGIGTQDPTRRITIRAEESNIQGPHMNVYIKGDSNHPLFEQLNWNHDDITQSFDAYFDGNDWISSSSTGNFQIKKKNGRLLFCSACNTYPGSNLTSSWFNALTINSNSYIGIGTSNPKHRLSLQGPSNSVLGPHIATYVNDSNNPAFQLYTLNHNMISMNFDCWWNGFNYISSSSNANIQMIKQDGKLVFQSAPSVIPGNIVDPYWFPAFTINSNNYIGVRNSNPMYPLDVHGDAIFRNNIKVDGFSVLSGIKIIPTGASNVSLPVYDGIGISNDILGVSIITSNSPLNYIKFMGSNSELARFTGDGKFGIGIINPTYTLQLGIDSAAKPATSTWTITSDERIKENIMPANLDICYSNIRNMQLRRFAWKSNIYTDVQIDDRTKLGWIAQEVEKVFPKAVKIQNMFGIEDCRTLNSDQIYACVFGCVQKLQLMVEDISLTHSLMDKRIDTRIDSLEKITSNLMEENRILNELVKSLLQRDILNIE